MIELQVYALLTRGERLMEPWPVRAVAGATITLTALFILTRAFAVLPGRKSRARPA